MNRSTTSLVLLITALLTSVGGLLWTLGEGPSEPDGQAASATRPDAVVEPPPVLAGAPGLAGTTPVADPAPLVSETAPPTDEPDRSAHLLRHAHDEAARLAAAERLAEWVPGPGEAPLLAAFAEDDSLAVREQALRSLEGAGSAAYLDACAQALQHADTWIQDAGESGLYRLDDRQAAVATLARLCADPDRAVRLRAAELLDEMDAGPLAWDDLYFGPVELAWAPDSGTDHRTPDDTGDDG